MKSELLCIVERFPGFKEKILTLSRRNDQFQSLCSDYLLCIQSMHRLEINLKKDEKFVEEYMELRSDLERELLQFIQHHCGNPSSSKT